MEEFEVLGFQIGAWQLFGFAGTLAFSSRFLVQWVASERAGESYVPVAFWYLSLLGSGILMAYGIHERDAVIVLGQSFGWVVYTRNLWLLHRSGRDSSPSATGNAPPS